MLHVTLGLTETEMHNLCRVGDLIQVGESLQECIFLGNYTNNGIRSKVSARIGISVEKCCDRFLKAGWNTKKKLIKRQPGSHRH